MTRVRVLVDDNGAKAFLVDLGDRVTDRRGLNQSLARRLAEELREHWRKKNQKPNKLGGKRTNFWSGVADQTAVQHVDENGATVVVGDEPGKHVLIHIFGGHVAPLPPNKALTIPIVREAHGLRAFQYEQKTGNDLFTIPGRNLLFEKPDKAAPTESLVGRTVGKKRSDGIPWSPGTIIGTRGVRSSSTVVPLAARQTLRPIYLLSQGEDIPADPDALPGDDHIKEVIVQEIDDFFKAL